MEPTSASNRPNPAPVIAAAPLQALRDELSRDVEALRRLAPAADVCTVLSSLLDRLTDAMQQASDASIQITVADAAVALRMSEEGVRYQIRTGRLEAERFGRTYYLSLRAVQRFARRTNRECASDA